MSLPSSVMLTAQAADDLEELRERYVDVDVDRHLERGGVLTGYLDGNQAVIERIWRNIDIVPYSPYETTIDWAATSAHDHPGRACLGHWHSHHTLAPLRPSPTDRKTWRKMARDAGELWLNEQVYVGMIVAPTSYLDHGFSRTTWSKLRMVAFVTNRTDQREAIITTEPKWMADLEAGRRQAAWLTRIEEERNAH